MKHSSVFSVRTKIILLLSLFVLPSLALAKSPYYLGLEPQFNTEEWYGPNELNTNILPFVYEKPLNEYLDLSLRSHVFQHTGGAAGTAISLVGVGAAWLWYLDSVAKNGHQGFSYGPAAIFSYDYLEHITHTTLALEAGYAFAVSELWRLNVAMQAGRSFFSGGIHPAANHFGIYVSFGRWL